MKQTILCLLLLVGCSTSPYQPEPLTPQEQIDSLKAEVCRLNARIETESLDKSRWWYLAQCYRQELIENGIKSRCHGGI